MSRVRGARNMAALRGLRQRAPFPWRRGVNLMSGKMVMTFLAAVALACGGAITEPIGSGNEPSEQGLSVAVFPEEAAVATGGTVTFAALVTGTAETGVSWSVEEGDAGGFVTTAGLFTAPATEGTYHVVARSQADATKSATAAVTVTAEPPPPPPALSWDVTVSPPALTDPTIVTLDGSNYLTTISHTLCTGPGYSVRLDDTKDYIVRTTSVLHAPVQIIGGRNVRIVGLQIDLDTAACSTSGLSGYAPGVIALKVSQFGTTFIEGSYIDLRRRSTDCIVARNPIGGGEALSKGYSEADARGARDVIVQNSICRGFSGESAVHGDVIQTQGLHELYRNIVFENVSVDSNCEGTMLDSRDGYSLANSITMRRFDFRMDPRYTPNPKTGGGYWTGGPVMHSAKTYSYDRVYLDHDVVRQYSATRTITSPPCDGSTGVHCSALPPGPDRYASPGTGAVTNAWTGLNYVSPHP